MSDETTGKSTATSFFDLKVNDQYGKPYDLSALRGKVTVVVNVASKCGFTPNYGGLEKLYQAHKDKGLVILGFPCNQFGSQAPGSAEEEGSFCQRNYGVSFPILEKVEVNGDNVHPVYVWLKEQKAGLLGLRRIKWNFEKFVVDKDGKVVNRYASTTTPEAMEAELVKLLG
ncbi:thioredoxin-like protein [Fimicolochytrium jonesii]|uniref:thioredoxin-like protein n=1 Tax=Fimicolochytrium jonesii TaxID=1396493 RepID=UPI0022FEA311|nr:thioredoxin-like protein [Fimicolochytrium jonesii]KAI8821411.1 thioredoxin-like protein [Fimicolochytrium jonesii]